MKANVLLCLGLLTLGSCSLWDIKKATDYNNAIVTEQTKVIAKVLELQIVMKATDSLAAQQKRAELVALVDSSLVKVNTLSYKGDDMGLKKSFVKLLQFYKSAFTHEYSDMIAVNYDDNASLAEITAVQEQVENITRQESILDEQLGKSQAKFARAHKMHIGESTAQQKVDQLKAK